MLALVILWRVYFAIATVFIISSLSGLIFGRGKSSLKRALNLITISFFWPIALFSPKGRKQLFNQTQKI
jgi:hypothetical protein